MPPGQGSLKGKGESARRARTWSASRLKHRPGWPTRRWGVGVSKLEGQKEEREIEFPRRHLLDGLEGEAEGFVFSIPADTEFDFVSDIMAV